MALKKLAGLLITALGLSQTPVVYSPPAIHIEIPEIPQAVAETLATTHITPEPSDDTARGDSIYDSCVRTAIAEGLNIPLIDADKLVPNSYPAIGAGVLLKYKSKKTGEYIYHVTGPIKVFTENGYSICEGNFEAGKRTCRIIDFNDSHIIGFIR